MSADPPPPAPGEPWMARLERAAPLWFRSIPLLLICGLLVVLVVVPIEMGQRREALRRQIGEVISPAQAALLESEAAFAYEVAVYRGFLATGDSGWLGTLRQSHQDHSEAMRRFTLLARRVGPELQPSLADLKRRKREWLANPEALLAGRVPRATLLARLPRSEAQLQDVLAASGALNRQLLWIDARRRADIQANDAREHRMVMLLGLAAFLVALTFGWLSLRLARITRELEEERRLEAEARATAEAAVRTRDEVLRVVSHDLKNPLHTIGMVAQLLTDIPFPEEERAAKLEIIRRTVDRAHRLVLDLLDVARLEREASLTVDRAPVPCTELVRDAVETVQVQATEKEQRLSWDVADDMGDVCADRDRILQVFTNLLGNAVKFTPEGGAIRVLARREGPGGVCFQVCDTGPGIAPEDLPNLFVPFWQAPSTAALGTGLGLTIARAIVEAHGGEISVASVPGEGTTFSFTIPLAG